MSSSHHAVWTVCLCTELGFVTVKLPVLKNCFQLRRCSLQGLLCDLGQTFQLSPPGVSMHVTMREHPAGEGVTAGEKCPGILPKCRLSCYI